MKSTFFSTLLTFWPDFYYFHGDFLHSKMMCTLFLWGEGLRKRMVCTLMKMLTFMDGPLLYSLTMLTVHLHTYAH